MRIIKSGRVFGVDPIVDVIYVRITLKRSQQVGLLWYMDWKGSNTVVRSPMIGWSVQHPWDILSDINPDQIETITSDLAIIVDSPRDILYCENRKKKRYLIMGPTILKMIRNLKLNDL